MTKQNFFWAFEFYKKEELKETKKTIKSQAKQLLNFKQKLKKCSKSYKATLVARFIWAKEDKKLSNSA